MFKNPKTKEIVQVGKGFAAFEVGKRGGRGVVGLANHFAKPKNENEAQIIKGVIAVAALYGAAGYNGKNKDLVVPGLVGVAAEQVGDIIDAQAAKHITKKPDADLPQKFLQDAMGLGCPCDQPEQMAIAEWNDYGLNSPAIQEIEWDSVYTGDQQNGNSNSFGGA